MTDDLLTALDSVLGRWSIGGEAASAAPAAWRPLLDEAPDDAELRTLALASHYLDTCVVAEPREVPRTAPDLPPLGIPPTPADVRPLVRRVLAATSGETRAQVVEFVTSRGWAMHPADWLPSATSTAVPVVYAPWVDWVASRRETTGADADEPSISAETWDAFGSAARVAALIGLREQDPSAAGDLIAARFAGESADHRLALVGVLERGLTAADAAILEGLAGDRAPRVRSAALGLLARIGHGKASSDDAGELAEFFTADTVGVLKRTPRVRPTAIKTAARGARRAQLFGTTDLTALAAQLGMTPESMVTAWAWGVDHAADLALAAAVARGGTDAVVTALLDAVDRDPTAHAGPIFTVLQRVERPRRILLAQRWLASADGLFRDALRVGGLGANLADPLATPAGGRLVQSFTSGDGAVQPDPVEVHALGMLASRDGAVAAIDRLNRVGVLTADPRLDIVRLNAALETRE